MTLQQLDNHLFMVFIWEQIILFFLLVGLFTKK